MSVSARPRLARDSQRHEERLAAAAEADRQAFEAARSRARGEREG